MKCTDITSVTEHRDHLRDHLNQVKETGRPLFITSKGEAEAVMLSAAAYDALIERAGLVENLAMISRSLADIEAGRTKPMKQAIADIADELGIEFKK